MPRTMLTGRPKAVLVAAVAALGLAFAAPGAQAADRELIKISAPSMQSQYCDGLSGGVVTISNGIPNEDTLYNCATGEFFVYV